MFISGPYIGRTRIGVHGAPALVIAFFVAIAYVGWACLALLYVVAKGTYLTVVYTVKGIKYLIRKWKARKS